MTSMAYVVGHVDAKRRPPRIVSVGVYSASALHLTRYGEANVMVDIVNAPGDSFQDAVDNALASLLHPWFSWTVRLLPQEERRRARRAARRVVEAAAARGKARRG